jgi:hypothetical protein
MNRDAQPCAQPDEPVRGFVLTRVGAARRLAKFAGRQDFAPTPYTLNGCTGVG